MKLNDLTNKKIAFLGLGVENYALLQFLLKKKIVCRITIYEKKQKNDIKQYPELSKFKNITWIFGAYYAKNLSGFDIIFRSPGSLAHKDRGVNLGRAALTSAMNLFFDLCPTKNIIGVTGTKGKGTTASLIYAILKTAGKRAYLGGNIGTAPFEFLPKIKPSDFVVLELSSFQLEDITKSPPIAVLTNFYAEHLAPADPFNPNYHHNLAEYLKAKLNITHWQKKNDWLVINQKLKSRNKQQTTNNIIYFTKSNLPSKLVGEHNKENIAAAAAVAKILKIKPAVIARAVKNFPGLEHRLEFVRERRGVKYFDDSFATTPESAIIALKSFNAPIILLAGGAEKNSNFKQLAKTIKQRAKFVCLLNGRATPRLKRELNKVNFTHHQIFNNLAAAVKTATRQAAPGDIVLLSTGCASFGMFANYKERGKLFKQEVKKL